MEIIWSAMKIGSFYFWLDLLATLSMVFEIPWMSSASFEGEGDPSSLDSARAGKASKAGAKAAKIIKIVRMVCLVRMVKLYKYFSENRHKKEGSVAPGDKSIDNMPPESHVGAEMSDRTTKKVIVGVLVMLVVIPMLQVDELHYIDEFGMQMIFERRSALSLLGNDPMMTENAKSVESWEFSEQYFINTTNCIELTYDGFNDGEHNVAAIPEGRPMPEKLRASELVMLTIEGKESSIKAAFDNSEKADEEALLGILLTSFVIVLLAVGTMTFSNDVNNLVILPIEKMVQLIKEISENPLGEDFSFKPEETKDMDDGMETTLLLRTISKIAGLMRVGFGEAGAEIIGKNLNMCNDERGGSSMNLLGNGTKIKSIFGFCDVRNFTDTTECVQEEVMLFVNRIAHILHSIVAQCGGAANKNIGDAFLLTWKLDPKKLGTYQEQNGVGDQALYSLLKTVVEMSRHEDFICNFSPTALGALYERMPGYKCRMGCGLHVGWAVEGAISSDKKIDASYISLHVNWAEFLESSTKEYGVPLLMSEPFYKLLSPQAAKYCRQVDNIKKSMHDDVTGLFAYDANLDGVNFKASSSKLNQRVVPVGRKSGHERKASRSVRNSARKSSQLELPRDGKIKTKAATSRIMGEAPELILSPFSIKKWETDEDIIRLRIHFKDEYRKVWNDGMEAFVAGDWSTAVVKFNEVLEMTHGTDGPSKHILSIMESYQFKVPEKWLGYRVL